MSDRSGPLCPICELAPARYSFDRNGYDVYRCRVCGAGFLHPQPDDAVLAGIYTADYFLDERTDRGRQRVADLKTATARLYLEQVLQSGVKPPGRLLEIGCGTGDFLKAAQVSGFTVQGVEISAAAAQTANQRLGTDVVRTGTVDTVLLQRDYYDVIAFFDVIEHVRNPAAFLKVVRQALKPGGVVILATPSLDSWSSKVLGRYWMEYKTEHLFYFDSQSLRRLLTAAGFEQPRLLRNHKVLSLDYICRHFQRFPVPLVSRVVRLMRAVVPAFVAHRRCTIVASGIVAIAYRLREKNT